MCSAYGSPEKAGLENDRLEYDVIVLKTYRVGQVKRHRGGLLRRTKVRFEQLQRFLAYEITAHLRIV